MGVVHEMKKFQRVRNQRKGVEESQQIDSSHSQQIYSVTKSKQTITPFSGMGSDDHNILDTSLEVNEVPIRQSSHDEVHLQIEHSNRQHRQRRKKKRRKKKVVEKKVASPKIIFNDTPSDKYRMYGDENVHYNYADQYK